MKKKNDNCNCGADACYVLACSGACDVGHISDLTARKLAREEVRKMNCLALAGAGIANSIETFRKSNVLIIDGCTVECGKKIADGAGITDYSHLRVTDLGFEKGKTPVNDGSVQAVFDRACAVP